ncbi:MAG: murG [Candidatus Berkelbacteria bacterium]|nr:murG [Candidatus Berkelbacteria bacterium]
MRILLVGGGTAGHVWPIMLVAKSLLKNHRSKILYVGSRQGIESKIIKDSGIPYKSIMVGKRRAYFSLSNYWDMFKTFIGILQSLFIILTFRPDVIFAKGGYVTFPIIIWLGFFKIPLVIHESDVVMGQANIFASKRSIKICLGFPLEYYRNIPLQKGIYTGIPVREEFLQPQIKSSDRLNILITGGSQGSSKINNLIYEILPELVKKYEVYHISGEIDFEKLSTFKSEFYHLYNFTQNIPELMRDADLIITRAGANTLAEISSTKKAAIIIPLTTAKGEHQVANAEVYHKNNAAVVISEEKMSANSLLSIVNNLMDDEVMRNLIGHHANSFFYVNSVGEIIDTIFEVAGEKK